MARRRECSRVAGNAFGLRRATGGIEAWAAGEVVVAHGRGSVELVEGILAGTTSDGDERPVSRGEVCDAFSDSTRRIERGLRSCWDRAAVVCGAPSDMSVW